MKAILFDIYGTLVDIHTEEESIHFWRKISKVVKKHAELSPNVLRSNYKCLCMEKGQHKEEIDILEVFEEILNVSKKEAEIIAWKFRKISTKYIHLYKGVKRLLKRLKAEGCKLYILSNAQEAFTLPELKKLGIYSCFDGIAISSAYGVKKPNLEFFQRAIKNFDLQGEIWMVGNDAECDIFPAKKLGLKTIFIESNLTPVNQEKDKMKGFDYQLLYEKIMKY